MAARGRLFLLVVMVIGAVVMLLIYYLGHTADPKSRLLMDKNWKYNIHKVRDSSQFERPAKLPSVSSTQTSIIHTTTSNSQSLPHSSHSLKHSMHKHSNGNTLGKQVVIHDKKRTVEIHKTLTNHGETNQYLNDQDMKSDNEKGKKHVRLNSKSTERNESVMDVHASQNIHSVEGSSRHRVVSSVGGSVVENRQALAAEWSVMEKRKTEERRKLVEEWQKLQEEKHKLLEDRIRWQKELGQWLEDEQKVQEQNAKLGPVDPTQWDGLNGSQVHTQYPGIILYPQYKIRDFVDMSDQLAAGMQGAPTDWHNLTDGQAEERFYQLITMTHMECGSIHRLGNTGDGGWDVCVSEPYGLRSGCIVYSFGINYDFTFDDAMATTFGCDVRTFDPSMNVGDHMHTSQVYFYQLGLGAANTVSKTGWKIQTLGTIMKRLGHLKKTVDILKIDIEHNEWGCLRTALKEGILRNVKQLLIEIHTPEVFTVGRASTAHDFHMMYSVLRGLEVQGMRRYHFHYNPLGQYQSVRTGKRLTCCFEMYFLNIKYLK